MTAETGVASGPTAASSRAPSSSSERSVAAIVDLGVGNLGNLQRAVGALGFDSTVTDDAHTIATSRTVLLPGVGAFRPPREALRGPLETALRHALQEGAWLLGICVGFQLLFEGSEEFGQTDGLALLPGRISRLPEGVPLPHIGWNALRPTSLGGEHPMLEGVAPGAHAYFVHSFAPEAVPEENVLATTLHGRDFPAVVGRGRVMGTQFHPEKSGHSVGLRILGNFLAMADAPRGDN